MTGSAALELARRIDISCVRAQHRQDDIKDLAKHARIWSCINAHVLPAWVPLLRDLLGGSETLVGSPIGFPSGGTSIPIKVAEAHQLVNDGAEELDIVMNIGRFLDGDHRYVARELRDVLHVIPKEIVTKVIIETSLLNTPEIRKATQLVVESGAAFVKTGTGWAGPVSPQSVETIASELDALAAKNVQIKAAGGIRTPADIAALSAVGATRFGIGLTAAVSILEDVSKN